MRDRFLPAVEYQLDCNHFVDIARPAPSDNRFGTVEL
jgi:hypothetical protein